MKRHLFIANERKRRAVSEIIGTLLMVAVTLVAGAGVFGFVNGQATSSESKYGASVDNNVNYLNEHFVIVNTFLSSTTLSVSLYNNGNVALNVAEITLTNYSSSVPWFKVVAFDNGTVNSYTKTGDIVCSASATTLKRGVLIAQNSVPPKTDTVAMPGTPITSGSWLGSDCAAWPPSGSVTTASYTVQVFGSFGNVVQSFVQASW